jgi:zinc protease
MAWLAAAIVCFFMHGLMAPAFAQNAPPPVSTLPNGMDVIVIEDRRAPVITVMVLYKAGAADETPGKSGIAHFLEHLMFTGTKTVADGEFDKLITRKGGNNNAFTSHDVTAYHENIGRDHLDLVLKLEADRMTNLILDEKRVAKERDVILEERNSSIDNQPAAKLREQMSALMFANHRYGVEVLGWRHEMERLSLADALAWYKTYYAPNNAILVVAGDVAPAEVNALAAKHFGPIPKRTVPPRVRAAEPPPIAARRVSLNDAQVSQAELTRFYLTPSHVTGNADAYALTLFADILGGGATSVMYRELVQKQAIAVSASASYDGLALEDSILTLSLTPAPGVSIAKAEAAMDALLAKVLKDGVAPAGLARSISRSRAAVIFQRDSRESLAQTYGWWRAIGLSVAEVFAWPDRIAEVTKTEVDAAARKYLTPERSVTGLLLPKGETAK